MVKPNSILKQYTVAVKKEKARDKRCHFNQWRKKVLQTNWESRIQTKSWEFFTEPLLYFLGIIIYNKNIFFSFQDIHKTIISKYFGTEQNSTLTKTAINSFKIYFKQEKNNSSKFIKTKKLHKKLNQNTYI